MIDCYFSGGATVTYSNCHSFLQIICQIKEQLTSLVIGIVSLLGMLTFACVWFTIYYCYSDVS